MGYSCFKSIKTLCFSLCILVGATSSQNAKCPFEYLYHFGDAAQDIGNSKEIDPSLPCTRSPYGTTFPGTPTGRWSDGRVDIDYIAAETGVEIVPYLSQNASTSNGVIFSVAGSTVLNSSFFAAQGVQTPPYGVSLSGQLSWLKEHLESVCSTPADCRNRLENSLVLMGDIEGNDVGYPLSQGKSLEEVRSYVPLITQEVVDVTRELIRMGATRIVIPGNTPLGCFPYILTAMPSNNLLDYDFIGCLRRVNNIIIFKNKSLQVAIAKLTLQYPNVTILYAPFYETAQIIISQARITGPKNTTLRACCGIGGAYNYDGKRFCGSERVSVCSNPEKYIFWDGLHLTQEAYRRIIQIVAPPALALLGCRL